MKILTAEQMAEVDRRSWELYRIPTLLLMESAGRAVVDELEKAEPGLSGKSVLIFCGKGNNGGDGLVAARYLAQRGGHPEVLLFGDPARLKGDALTNWEMVRSLDIKTVIFSQASGFAAQLRKLQPPDVIIDALFGTGLSKPIGPDYRRVIDWMNRARRTSFIASVDIPSGLFADSAAVAGAAVKADLTVTFTALKLALVVPPAADQAGSVVLVPIGSPSGLLDNPEYRLNLIDVPQARSTLPARPRDSHKGSFGHVFVVAGSRGKSGAALMTGLAALRSGAGLVTLYLPSSLQKDVVGKIPELMMEAIAETQEGTAHASAADLLLKQAEDANVLVVGPGMTTNRSTQELIRTLVRQSPVPVVLDADGINAFAGESATLRNQKGQPVIITPHPGEMARLLKTTIGRVQGNRIETARQCAEVSGAFSVLKGFQTIVATPTGQIFINNTGNPGMATAGSGDILAGILARFVAGWSRRFRGADLAALGDHISAAVYLHGLAGDRAAEQKGMESMIATDLLTYLPDAFKKVGSG